MTVKKSDVCAPCADDLTLKIQPSFDKKEDSILDTGLFESSFFEFEAKADKTEWENLIKEGLSHADTSVELQISIPIEDIKKRLNEQRGEKYTILISEREAEIIVDVLERYVNSSNEQTTSEEQLILFRLLAELMGGAWRGER